MVSKRELRESLYNEHLKKKSVLQFQFCSQKIQILSSFHFHFLFSYFINNIEKIHNYTDNIIQKQECILCTSTCRVDFLVYNIDKTSVIINNT